KPYSDWFHIKIAASGKVFATSKVDYDQLNGNHTVHLEIQASHTMPNSNNVLKATTGLDVKILDADDSNPYFSKEVYHLDITENNNSAVNVDLTTDPPIHAADGDEGINDTILYSIVELNAPPYFTIQPSGTIRVNQTLDRETKSFYVLRIRASEKNNTARTATATLSVNVIDVDDNFPVFINDTYTANISEHSSVGQVITTVKATDKDEGQFAEFKYELKENSSVIGIKSDTGEIYVKDSLQLDWEKMPHIFVQVITKSVLNDYQGHSIANVTINVLDINDNSPIFNQSTFNFYLYNASNGTYVAEINAFDTDSGDNAKLKYSFGTCLSNVGDCAESSCDFPFDIDSSTGNITVKANLLTCTYTALVTVCDSPKYSSSLCTSTSVTIQVNSLLSAPTFLISGEILENSAENSLVAKLPTQCQLNTTINCQKDENMFKVSNSGNMLVTSGVPDYENISSYICSACKKTTNGQIICTVILNITVRDENDNEPQFTNDTFLFKIPTNAEAGSYIGHVSANDKDKGGKQGVTYYIQESSVTDLFSLNETTGYLHMKNPEDLSRDYYQLTIVAADDGIPQLKSLGTVILHKYPLENNSLQLSTTRSQQEMQSNRSTFERIISDILKVNVTINEIVPVDGSQWSRIIISAKENGSHLSSDKLISKVLRHYDLLFSHLNGNYAYATSTVPKSDDSAITAPVLALIIIACVLFIGSLVAILVIRKQYNGHQRYKRLYDNLTKHSSLYESQELKVRMEDATSDYNGSVNSQDLECPDNIRTENPTSSMNPLYNMELPVSTSVAEVMLSLNELSERLNEEDNVPKPDYENVPLTNEEENVPKHDYENVPSSEDKNQTESGIVNLEIVRNGSPTPDYDQRDAPFESDNTGSIPNGVTSEPDSDAVTNSLNIDSERSNATLNEEPVPDYNKKQVRFSHQVLDPDENKMTPLKTEEDNEDGDNSEKGDLTSEINKDESLGKRLLPLLNLDNENPDEPKLNVSDETGWLEEEINSPIDVMTVDDKGNEFFEEEITSF
ncbi:hypothetical protein ACJMK2_029699, partial [Sinanodonta woodiana]